MCIHHSDLAERRSIRRHDTKKKWFRCLRCGRRIWTDRCHRFCPRCTDTNAEIAALPATRSRPQKLPITLVEIACYGLKNTASQVCGEVELTVED